MSKFAASPQIVKGEALSRRPIARALPKLAHAIWAHFAADFDEAVLSYDLDRAWQLLSQAA